MAIPAIVTTDYGKNCPPVLANLDEFLLKNPEQMRTKLALLGAGGFYRSAIGSQYREMDALVMGSGKIKTVEVSYLPRDVSTDLANPATVDPCTSVAIEAYETQTVTFTPVVSARKISFSIPEWRKTCESAEIGQVRRINAAMNALLVDHETKLFNQIITGAGGNAAYTKTPGEYAVINGLVSTTDGTLSAIAVQTMIEDVLVNENDDVTPVAFFGLTNPLRKAQSIREFGCCNDLGFDQSMLAEKTTPFAGYVSKTVSAGFVLNGELAADAAIDAVIMNPGSSQIVEYFRYEGESAFTDGESFGRMYTDPISGERFDMKVEFDSCNEVYTMLITKQSMAWTAPTDAFKTGDDLESVNGIWLYRFTNT